MKYDPGWETIRDNMQPGVITLDGFLGTDARDVPQIIDEDRATVQSLGLTNELIAKKMLYFRDSGIRGLGRPVDVAPHFSVRVDTVRGKLRCPFEHAGLVPKTNILVRNFELEEEIYYTDMNIHMIRQHGFYQGKGSLFRVSPARLAKVLEL